MNKTVAYNGIKNTLAVIVGLIIYLLTDTIISVVVGVLLGMFSQIRYDIIYFQIVLRFIITASNVRLITLAVNHIAVRNLRGHNIPEYIIGGVIIVTGIILCVTILKNKGFDIINVIWGVFNTLLGITLLFDAKEEMI